MDEPNKKTLKEKWNDHWHNRKISPPQEQANMLGICFFWLFTVSLMISTLVFAIPHHYRYNDSGYFWASVLAYFIFIESVANWVLCAVVKNDVKRTGNSAEGWKQCLVCQGQSPPRSYHCKICQSCVLKRDHHCFFTGVCVGFRNQRNFIVYTFYVLLGSIYGTYLLSHYIGKYYDVRSHEGWTFLPFVALWQLVFRSLPFVHFIFLIQMYTCIGMALVSAYFFLWQISVAITGMTTYEVTKSIKKYQKKNVFANLRDVFGPMWLIQFILPIPTTLPGDGMNWTSDNAAKWQ